MRTNVSLVIISVNLMLLACVSSTTLPPKRSGSQHSLPAIVPGSKQGNGNNNNNNNNSKCPKDTLKFGVCGSWLGLVVEVIGAKPSEECCTLLKGLADLEAASCLCTAIKASVLGVVKVEAPIALSLLVNGCGKKIPDGFVCA